MMRKRILTMFLAIFMFAELFPMANCIIRPSLTRVPADQRWLFALFYSPAISEDRIP